MKYSWLIIFYFTTVFGQKLDNQWNTVALQRLMHEWDVKLEKMELLNKNVEEEEEEEEELLKTQAKKVKTRATTLVPA